MANTKLPMLPTGWEWRMRGRFYAACLFTLDIDCYVEVTDGGSVQISTGVAPIEVVQAVITANSGKRQ